MPQIDDDYVEIDEELYDLLRRYGKKREREDGLRQRYGVPTQLGAVENPLAYDPNFESRPEAERRVRFGAEGRLARGLQEQEIAKATGQPYTWEEKQKEEMGRYGLEYAPREFEAKVAGEEYKTEAGRLELPFVRPAAELGLEKTRGEIAAGKLEREWYPKIQQAALDLSGIKKELAAAISLVEINTATAKLDGKIKELKLTLKDQPDKLKELDTYSKLLGNLWNITDKKTKKLMSGMVTDRIHKLVIQGTRTQAKPTESGIGELSPDDQAYLDYLKGK